MYEHLAQYKILERIGAGGLGDVYRARDSGVGRTVAIKVLPDSIAGDADRRARCVDDARAVAAVSHPNIATLFEIGEDQGRVFLAFEFAPGETLQAAIGGRPMNPRRALDLGHQIADALADAHAHGVVHTELKPAGVIVTPKGRAKILDCGLSAWTFGGAARRRAAEEDKPGVIDRTALGALAYMSPEQARGEEVDHRTDIFSLGVLLYEMLTGWQPISGATASAVKHQLLQAEAPRPSARHRSLPREIDDIVGRALARDRDARYDSAAALAADLRAMVGVLDARRAAGER